MPDIPGPRGGRVLGSLRQLRRDSLGTFVRARSDHGDVVRFVAGPPGLRHELFGLFSAQGVQHVLASAATNFRKDHSFYNEVRAVIGDGLLTSQDDTYLRQRRLIQPLFTRKHVDAYAPVIVEETEAIADSWHGRDKVDLTSEMTTLTLRVAARALLGTEGGGTAEDAIRRHFPPVSDYIVQRGFAPVNLPRHWPTPGNRRVAVARREMYQICDRLIAMRATGPPSDDLLSLLTRARTADGDRLSQQEIRDQVLVFLLAGHETTAHTLAFALQLLGRHPEVCQRLAEEADEVLAGRAPTAGDHAKLEYTAMVLKETMRLYPAAPVVGRLSVNETTVDGHRIPARANVLVSAWVTHRHPQYWPDPERFDPERFGAEAEKTRPRYAWFPFGGGPRACIGGYFALLESVLVAALLARRFRFHSVRDDVGVHSAVTLRPAEPIVARISRR